MTARLPLTKYHQIYLVLREQLQQGLFAQGIPAETELARQFGVGRVTVRHAMEQLVAEGLIVRVAGRGTFPTAQGRALSSPVAPVQAQPTRLAGLMENIVSASRSTTVKVLDWRTVAAPELVAAALNVELPPGWKRPNDEEDPRPPRPRRWPWIAVALLLGAVAISTTDWGKQLRDRAVAWVLPPTPPPVAPPR